MAREISEIQNIMLTEIRSTPELSELNSTSKTAIYRLMTYIVAVCVWTLEKLFDAHAQEVNTAIYNYKPGTPRWYKNKALGFQLGFNLLEDTDRFDNAKKTEQNINDSKIIKYCSVREGIESSRVIMKVAKDNANVPVELEADEIEAFTRYLKEVSYAGVKLQVINNPADKLQTVIDVYRNPLLINESGVHIATGKKMVEQAISNYLKNLKFNGEFVINDLIATIRSVEGVENCNVKTILASYKDLATGEWTDFKTIDVKTIPVAGYFKLDDLSKINYVV